MYKFFMFSFYLRTFCELNLFMNIAALVELTNSHSILISIVSLVVSYVIIFMLFQLTVLSVVHYIKYRRYPDIEDSKCSALYEGIKDNSFARFYTSLLLIRRLILAIFIVFVREGIAQLGVLIITQAASFLFMAIVRPFVFVKENLIDLINELMLLFLICAFTTMLDEFGLSDSEVEIRFTVILWIMMAVSLLCGAIIFIFLIVDIIGVIKAIFQKFRSRASKQPCVIVLNSAVFL